MIDTHTHVQQKCTLRSSYTLTRVHTHTHTISGRGKLFLSLLDVLRSWSSYPSYSTRVPIGLSNCSTRFLTGFPSQRKSTSDWLHRPRGETGTWQVRGVQLIRNKEERKKATYVIYSHKFTETNGFCGIIFHTGESRSSVSYQAARQTSLNDWAN